MAVRRQTDARRATAPGSMRRRRGRHCSKRVAIRLPVGHTVIAFRYAGTAAHADRQVEVAHPAPAGTLVPDAVPLPGDESDRELIADARLASWPARRA